GRGEPERTQGCLPNSCHSLNLRMENFAGILSGRFWTIAVTGNFQLECPAVLKLQYALKLVNRPQAQEIIIAPATELGIFRTVGRYPFRLKNSLSLGLNLIPALRL
ncbi:MAG: hypothetical protein PHR94_17005, partial [Methylomonas lenta]|nr:hypothetical protein [Methylomonas lenta]